MKIKIKKTHPNAILPKYAKDGDACMDLFCVDTEIDQYGNTVCNTGVAIEIPKDYVGLIFPRSSISKNSLFLRNSVGVIDSGYRGTIYASFGSYQDEPNKTYQAGDRVCQLMIMPFPKFEFEEVDTLSESDRGIGGFGSTGE